MNEHGELGIGDSQIKKLPSPRDITLQLGGEKITQISAGYYHSLILTEHNLYATGYNPYGQLGNGSTTNAFSPCCITKQFKGEIIQEINCGGCHSFVSTDKHLYSFGRNCDGELGSGSCEDQHTPSNIEHKFGGKQIKKIFYHFSHTIVQTDAGIYTFGQNGNG